MFDVHSLRGIHLPQVQSMRVLPENSFFTTICIQVIPASYNGPYPREIRKDRFPLIKYL